MKTTCRHQASFMQEDLKQPVTLRQSLSVLEGSEKKLNSIKTAILLAGQFHLFVFIPTLVALKPCQETSDFMTNSLLSGSGKLLLCPLHITHFTSFFSFNTLWPTLSTAVLSNKKLWFNLHNFLLIHILYKFFL